MASRDKRRACFDRLSMRLFLNAMKIPRFPHPEPVEGRGRTASAQRKQMRSDLPSALPRDHATARQQEADLSSSFSRTSTMTLVETLARPFVMISAVRTPVFRIDCVAFSISAASSARPKE